MSIVRRGNSKYWYIQFQMSGRTYVRSSKTTDRKVAERMEIEWRARIHRGLVLGDNERISLPEAVAAFLKTREGTPNHRGLFHYSKTILRELSHRRYLDELTNADLEIYHRGRANAGLSAQTIQHQFAVVRGSVKTARRLGFRVPVLEYPPLKIAKHPVRYLSIQEEARLLRELDPNRWSNGIRPPSDRDDETRRNLQDCYDLVICLLDTGARYSEIADIRWDQIDLDQGVIRLWRSKVSNEGIIAMTNRVKAVLTRRFETDPHMHVFKNKKGAKRGYAVQSIKKAMKRAGLVGVRIHSFRHTLATRLVQNGMSIYEVKAILGHTDIKTTMRYAHLEQQQVAYKARNILEKIEREGGGYEKINIKLFCKERLPCQKTINRLRAISKSAGTIHT